MLPSWIQASTKAKTFSSEQGNSGGSSRGAHFPFAFWANATSYVRFGGGLQLRFEKVYVREFLLSRDINSLVFLALYMSSAKSFIS